jgi:hypothetical protein
MSCVQETTRHARDRKTLDTDLPSAAQASLCRRSTAYEADGKQPIHKQGSRTCREWQPTKSLDPRV